MNRGRFLQNAAVASAGIGYLSKTAEEVAASAADTETDSVAATLPDIEGHSLVCEFKNNAINWKVYEDLRTREGVITFVPSRGNSRVLGKSAEATFSEA